MEKAGVRLEPIGKCLQKELENVQLAEEESLVLPN